jgi:hypothetical protein
MIMRYAIVGAVLVAIAAAWFVMAGQHAPREGLDLSRSKSTEKGIYEVSVEPESEPVEQGPLHSWIAAVRSADGRRHGCGRWRMPDHGHGLPTAPKASHIGDGHYRIEGVRFNMSGWWELRLTIDGSKGEDVVVFNIML